MQFDKHMTRAMQLVNFLGTTEPSGRLAIPEQVAKHVTYEAQRELALSEVSAMQDGNVLDEFAPIDRPTFG